MISVETWGVLATVLAVVGYGPYILSFIKGQSKPHVFSWLLWGLTSFVVALGQHEGGAGPGLWMVLAQGVICTLVALFAVRWGERNITTFDWAAVGIGVLGMLAWYLTNHIVIALLAMALLDLMAFVPTWRKSWHKPEEEALSLYVINTVAVMLSVLAVADFNFLSAFNLIFFGAVQTAFVIMAYWRKHTLSQWYGRVCPI